MKKSILRSRETEKKKQIHAEQEGNKLISGICLFFFVFSALAIDVKLTRYKLLVIDLSVLFLFIVWVAGITTSGKLAVKKNYLNLPVLVYGITMTVYYLFSRDRVVAKNEFHRMLLCVGIFYTIANNFPAKKTISRLLYAWVMGALFVCLNGLSSFWAVKNPGNFVTTSFSLLAETFSRIDNFFHLPVREFFGIAHYGPNERPFATFGNPTFFASYLIVSLPIFFSLFLMERKKRKILLGGVIALLLVNLYFTATRSAWLGFVFSGLIFFLLYRHSTGKKGGRKLNRLTVRVFLPLLLLIFLHLGLIYTSESYKRTLRASKKRVEEIILRRTERLLIWRDTLVMGLKNPFGVGIGAFHIYFPHYASQRLLEALPPDRFIVNYAHNEFLELWSETGLIGIGVFLWIVFCLFQQGKVLIREMSIEEKEKVFICGLIASAGGVLVDSLFSVSMRFIIIAVYFYLTLGLLAGHSREEVVFPLKIPRWGRGVIGGGLVILGFFSVKEMIQPFRAHTLLSREVDFFEEKVVEADKAIKNLQEVIKTQPGNAMAYYRLGWIYAKEKNWMEAIRNFEIACQLDPSLAGARNNLGNIYFTLGNREKAIENYKMAIAVSPDLVDAHFNLGYCYYTLGRLKEASDEFKKVLQLDPDNHKALIMIEKMVQ